MEKMESFHSFLARSLVSYRGNVEETLFSAFVSENCIARGPIPEEQRRRSSIHRTRVDYSGAGEREEPRREEPRRNQRPPNFGRRRRESIQRTGRIAHPLLGKSTIWMAFLNRIASSGCARV